MPAARIHTSYGPAASEFVIAMECFIIQTMRVEVLHEWEVSVAQAREIQLSLAKRVSTENKVANVRLIAGIDISAPDAQGIARGAVVVLCYPELDIVEVKEATAGLHFPMFLACCLSGKAP